MPIQFQLGGNQGMNVLAVGFPHAQQLSGATSTCGLFVLGLNNGTIPTATFQFA